MYDGPIPYFLYDDLVNDATYFPKTAFLNIFITMLLSVLWLIFAHLFVFAQSLPLLLGGAWSMFFYPFVSLLFIFLRFSIVAEFSITFFPTAIVARWTVHVSDYQILQGEK